ncbi:ATP-binding protein [Cohnella thermotolerans]|uniref:ATP-binding protein n=1 Tax=Cohnella thermotolerans TaxID=329858 RepID=UPI0003FDD077|nr:ATP-binding protein [Cohnella thermotolerans]
MWQYSLLQFLITLFPVGAVQLWLIRPERTRYAPAFIGAACGVSMLLCMLVSCKSDYSGIDLRIVPYLIGSLYGGIPSASILTVLYMTARLAQLQGFGEIVLLGLFFVVFVPLLFRRVQFFQGVDRKGKDRAVLQLLGVCFVFLAGKAVWSFAEESWEPGRLIGIALLFGGLIAGVSLLSVHFIEYAYERVRMLSDYRELSAKYANEVRRFQQFIDFSPLVVFFIDRDGRISHLNDLALKLLTPLARKDILHFPYRPVLQMWGGASVVDAVGRVMRGEDQATDLIRFKNRLYYATAFSWREAPLYRAEGAMLIAHDITEQQRLKDEVDKMERLSLVGQMAASITHEIRNPMAVIRGFVQLLNERSPKEQQSYFHIILQELDRANAIINDFLSLAQNRIVEKSESDLHSVLEDLLPLLRADANMRGQMIELRLCDRVDPLELNVKEIKQLILNLARNGMEAMDDKGVLRLETLNLADTVQLKVIDSGVGIPPEKLERLFEPFYTTKANGNGLGLALCLSIVERHNGKIHVESKLGQGTTFVVSFCKPGCQCW